MTALLNHKYPPMIALMISSPKLPAWPLIIELRADKTARAARTIAAILAHLTPFHKPLAMKNPRIPKRIMMIPPPKTNPLNIPRNGNNAPDPKINARPPNTATTAPI